MAAAYLIDQDGNIISSQDGEPILTQDGESIVTPSASVRTANIIEPIAITDAMVGSGAGTVPEGDFAEYDPAVTYATGNVVIVKGGDGILGEPLINTSNTWRGMCAAPNGNIYACAYGSGGSGSYVQMRASGSGDFKIVQGALLKKWKGMCAAPNGNIYASVEQGPGNIYMQTAGMGAFISLAQTDRLWQGMCASPSGHVFACVYGGDIYKQTDGSGNFVALTAGNKNWIGMACAPNGDIYAAVFSGDIWVSVDGGASFSVIADTDRNWTCLCALSDGSILAGVFAGDIYKRTAGAGTFVALGNVSKQWMALCSAPNGDIYGASTDDAIYMRRSGTIHKIYESLVDSNLTNYPPPDVLATTPKWAEVSSTNKWKVFDGKVANQMQVVSPAVYIITPGVSFNSVALLNVEATSVRIQVDSPAYDQTISTGITDIVKMDLEGDAASVLTITITNTAGLAKCGEIIVGNYTTLGTLQRSTNPTWSYEDYSTKERDIYGDWKIIPRDDSETLSFLLGIDFSTQDTLAATIRRYKTTPVVVVAHSDFSCLITYGIIKSISIPIVYRGKTLVPIDVDGLV
jgi:hypothetical protein